MADTDPGPEEALTAEEIQSSSEQPRATEKRKNAFTALMASRKKTTPKESPKPAARSSSSRGGGNPFKDRMGLGAYLGDPSAFPASVVVSYDDEFVVIRDRFPKATVHALILPRSSSAGGGGANLLHPFDALADPALLARVRAQAVRVRALVAAELQRLLGPYSRSEAARQAALDGYGSEEEGRGAAVSGGGGGGTAEDGEGGQRRQLPPGRDWAAEVLCGVHAVPSMRHVHVHVLSRDMHSSRLKHRKHYNSFTTPFLVGLDDFPLAADDPRRNTREQGYLGRDLVCWRCGRDFGGRFAELKEHLEYEFEEWKRE